MWLARPAQADTFFRTCISGRMGLGAAWGVRAPPAGLLGEGWPAGGVWAQIVGPTLSFDRDQPPTHLQTRPPGNDRYGEMTGEHSGGGGG